VQLQPGTGIAVSVTVRQQGLSFPGWVRRNKPENNQIVPVKKEGIMKLNVKALAITSAILWAGVLLFVGIIHLAGGGSYGAAFLKMVASFYPGYDAIPTGAQLIILVLYGAVDGAICGFLFAWVYNLFAGSRG
jgi:hypothetical protein